MAGRGMSLYFEVPMLEQGVCAQKVVVVSSLSLSLQQQAERSRCTGYRKLACLVSLATAETRFL